MSKPGRIAVNPRLLYFLCNFVLVKYSLILIFSGALCNHISGCTGFSWGSPDHPTDWIQKKCHLKSGSVTDNIVDNADIVSGLVGCPPPSPVIASDCSMTDKDLLGGASLITIKNIETWQDCGNYIIALFLCFIFSLERYHSYANCLELCIPYFKKSKVKFPNSTAKKNLAFNTQRGFFYNISRISQ